MSRSLRSQKVYEDTEEADADIVVSEISVTGGGEKQETLQQAKETDLFGKILEMMEEEKKSKGEILNRLEVLNERFDEKLELEKLQRSKDVFILREETQQTIQGVNGKLNKRTVTLGRNVWTLQNDSGCPLVH
jgi:archaellum component FlaC